VCLYSIIPYGVLLLTLLMTNRRALVPLGDR
jgi:hypothetical protein